MVKILYILGDIDGTYKLDPSKVTGDINVDRDEPYLQALKSGSVVSVDSNGYVKLAEDGDLDVGILVHSVLGDSAFTNVPAIASGRVTVLIGGAVVDIDGIVGDFAPGTKLYIGIGENAGKLVTTAPATDSVPVGVVRDGKSTEGDRAIVRIFV